MKPYGGVPREDRIGEPAMCDRAWHLGAGKGPVDALVVLTCAHCGRRYARCLECEATGIHAARTSMRAHVATCALAHRRRERRHDDE